VPDRVLAAILAGGAGRRLGGAKPTTLLAGRPLIYYPLAAATGAGLDAVVVAKRATPLPPLACELLIEPDEPTHPLLGIITALKRSPTVLVVACDMPFVTPELLTHIASHQPPAVVIQGGIVQPLLALYRQSQLPYLESALQSGTSATATVASATTIAIDHLPHATRLTTNINDATQLATAERIVTTDTSDL
jgi:molybdopterin-guanine dinucleotide biosynthesis protein A